MKDLVIVGTGSFATLMKFYITQYDTRKVVAFSVEQAYINEPFFEGIPICPLERLTEYYSADVYDVLLSIGAKDMNKLRERLFHFCKEKGYHIASFVHPSCLISPDAQIGEGNIFLENILIQPFVKIGNGNLFWDHVAISHNETIGDFNTMAGGVGLSGFIKIGNNCQMAPNVAIYTAGHPVHPVSRNSMYEYGKEVTIGDNVWLGGNTVVCPGVHIGSNVVIGAGSVVTKDIPDWCIAAGNPCKVLRRITDEDQNKLFRDEEIDEEAWKNAPKSFGLTDGTLAEAKKFVWWQMIQLLPSSYNQKRTVMLNYEVLSNIYQHRRNHKLNEWRELCKWIEGLPYSEVITCNAAKQEEDSSIVAAITKLKNEQWSTEDIVALLLGQTKKEYMKLFSDDTDKMPVHGGAFEIPAVMADNTKND